MKMSNLKRRNNKANCPVCGQRVVRGSSANWCPTFHYTAEHRFIDGKDFLVAEFFQGANNDFTICVGYLKTFHAPEGVSIRVHPRAPSEPKEPAWVGEEVTTP